MTDRLAVAREALKKIASGTGIGGPNAEFQCADIARNALVILATPVPPPDAARGKPLEATAHVTVPDDMSASDAARIIREHALELQSKLDRCEPDAQAEIDQLRSEVGRLKEELEVQRECKEHARRECDRAEAAQAKGGGG